MNSRTGPPSAPLRISSPDAPVEKSPLIGFTPRCSPCTTLDQHAIGDVGDELGLGAVARLQLQREATDSPACP